MTTDLLTFLPAYVFKKKAQYYGVLFNYFSLSKRFFEFLVKKVTIKSPLYKSDEIIFEMFKNEEKFYSRMLYSSLKVFNPLLKQDISMYSKILNHLMYLKAILNNLDLNKLMYFESMLKEFREEIARLSDLIRVLEIDYNRTKLFSENLFFLALSFIILLVITFINKSVPHNKSLIVFQHMLFFINSFFTLRLCVLLFMQSFRCKLLQQVLFFKAL